VVAKLTDLGETAIRFETGAIVVYIIRSDGDTGEKPGKPDKASPVKYLAALPRLETRITKQGANQFIEVRCRRVQEQKGGRPPRQRTRRKFAHAPRLAPRG
jgi:hypothetical protein